MVIFRNKKRRNEVSKEEDLTCYFNKVAKELNRDKRLSKKIGRITSNQFSVVNVISIIEK